jgi:hypothetical protein
MNILPASKQAWLTFALFPIKAIAIIVPIWVIIISGQSYYVREAYYRTTGLAMWGDALCVPIFIAAAIVQYFAGRRSAAVTNIVFAIGVAIGWVLLLRCVGWRGHKPSETILHFLCLPVTQLKQDVKLGREAIVGKVARPSRRRVWISQAKRLRCSEKQREGRRESCELLRRVRR